MRLFLIAFSLSCLATAASGVCIAQEPDGSTPQPMRQSRFESSSAQIYLMTRARQDVEHRTAMLRYYDAIGFNFGQPEINGAVNFTAHPPVRYRRVFFFPTLGTQSSPGTYGY